MFSYPILPQQATLFVKNNTSINFRHKENEFNDFTIQPLLPQYYSRQGPCIAKGDVNNDALEDVFIGGAKGQPGRIFLQTAKNTFIPQSSPAIEKDSLSEDVDAVFFDADNDKDLDLYVVSGGYEFANHSPELNDRLYLNDGKGHYIKNEIALPAFSANKSCVRPYDVDGDGDLDLFIGGTVAPGMWPQFAASRLLLNNGNGIFKDATQQFCPALKTIGLVKDAAWVDVDNDKIKDLIIVGEWMNIEVFINKKNTLLAASDKYISFPSSGWWNKILVSDFDKDGDEDFVLANYGSNGQLSATEKEPVQLYSCDIDGNGTIDPVLTSFIQHKAFPFITLDDMLSQVPSLKKKFYNYSNYADATITEIIPATKLNVAKPLQAFTFKTVYLENTGNALVKRELPVEAQYAPVYAMVSVDANGDGNSDLLLFGNNEFNRMKLSQYDANYGQVFLGNGKGNFTYLAQNKSGLSVKGDVRCVQMINRMLIIGINNKPVQTYGLKTMVNQREK